MGGVCNRHRYPGVLNTVTRQSPMNRDHGWTVVSAARGRKCVSVYTIISESCPRMTIHGIGRCCSADRSDLNCVSAIDVERSRCALRNALIHERKKIAAPVETGYRVREVKEESKRCRCGTDSSCDVVTDCDRGLHHD